MAPTAMMPSPIAEADDLLLYEPFLTCPDNQKFRCGYKLYVRGAIPLRTDCYPLSLSFYGDIRPIGIRWRDLVFRQDT